MANEFCQIPPADDTKNILSLLPPLPGINQIVDLINKEVNNLKIKYTNKAQEMLASFAEGVCPTQQQIDIFIRTRNNIVNQLIKVYDKVDRLSSNISGVTSFLTAVITGIKVASGLANGITLGTAAVPFPIPAAVNSLVEGAQAVIEKSKFKVDGAQKLVPLTGGLISANIAVKLFANALRELICTIDALDIAMLDCSTPPVEDPNNPPTQEEILRFKKEVKDKLVPIPTNIIGFVEQDVNEEERSLIDTAYRGFTFEIEEIPFSPTVNRKRAVAKNKDGVTLLQTELSFTSTPDILIQELKFVIDRDNLRAD